MKMILALVAIVAVVAIGLFFYFDMDEGQVAVKQTYSGNGEITKIVYEISEQSTISACARDCSKRGGTFEECGNPCAPGAQACETVCAVTCTFD